MTDLLNVAQGNLNNLDLTEATKELEDNAKLFEKASAIVGVMDGQLEKGTRISVADKYLLNCQTDLNQLVPFKYSFLWSLYLTSCNNHWMPQETMVDDDWEKYSALPLLQGKLAIARAWLSHVQRIRDVFPASTILVFYRLFTNPEIRQYLLRQLMEATTEEQMWNHCQEIYNFDELTDRGKNLGQMLSFDEEVFSTRFTVYSQHIQRVLDPQFNTKTIIGGEEFILAFVSAYWSVNVMGKIVDLNNILHIAREHGMGGFESMVGYIARDVASQLTFFELTMKQILEENPELMTVNLALSLEKLYKDTLMVETTYASDLMVDSTVVKALTGMASATFSTVFGIKVNTGSKVLGSVVDDCPITQAIESLRPTVSNDVGVGGSQLGW